MEFNGSVVGELVGCTELFIFPVSLLRISVKFRKVPRENETDAKQWMCYPVLFTLSCSSLFNMSVFLISAGLRFIKK